MHKVDVWVWTDNRTPQESLKGYAYSIEMERAGKFIRKGGEGEICATWNRATLIAIAEALERFSGKAEVIIHSENFFVMNMFEHHLPTWEQEGFLRRDGKDVANRTEWERIAKKKQLLQIETDTVGFDRSKELMEHALSDEVPPAAVM